MSYFKIPLLSQTFVVMFFPVPVWAVGNLDPTTDGKNRSKLSGRCPWDKFLQKHQIQLFSAMPLCLFVTFFSHKNELPEISRRSQDDDEERIAFASNEWSQEAPENVNQDRKIFGRKLHLVWRFQRSGILLQLSTLEEMRMLSFLLFHLLRQF